MEKRGFVPLKIKNEKRFPIKNCILVSGFCIIERTIEGCGYDKRYDPGNPTRLIISFTLPVLFGNLCQQLYGMVDSIIVGRAISMEALAAVGATSGISFLVIGCIQGLTAGFSVITAQRFGAGDYEGVKRSVATSALLSLAATVLLTAAGIFNRKASVGGYEYAGGYY